MQSPPQHSRQRLSQPLPRPRRRNRRPLLNLLAHMRESGFIRPGFEVHTLVAEQAEDILPMLEAAARRRGTGAEKPLPL